ncbi:MAG: tadC [Deltaproteobacteria bacterium]|nr:tadC [Deltaproteobacteria bacterium]MBP2678011.1 tadC [Deltaproteobacteria bacterium]MBP2689079.1 tadC [Deltaproteobacteria bacterium]
MILIVAVSVFLATAAGAFGLYWILESRQESLQQRFKEVIGKADAPGEGVAESTGKWIDMIRKRFTAKTAVETDLVAMLSGKELVGGRLLLNQAGYRSPGAYHAYLLVRWALPPLVVTLSLVGGKIAGVENRSIFLAILIAGIVGFLLPDFALRRRIHKRQEEITDALPDGLDLLVVCVEAGLGLNAAFVKITEEFRLSSPALSEEFDIVNREMVAGKPRQEALRALSERTGVEDVKSLVAMLIQTEKLGTSLAQSLRVHSDSLRLRRRQRAEEAAAKTTIKLVFPLVFLMFPALFIVILGPGALQIIKILIPMGAK